MKTIYKVTCIPTGQVYIGQTGRRLSRRMNDHCHDNGRTLLRKAIDAHGREAFVIEELMCVPDFVANILEAECIKAWGSHFSVGGLNKTRGYHDNAMNYIDSRAKAAEGGKLGWPLTH